MSEYPSASVVVGSKHYRRCLILDGKLYETVDDRPDMDYMIHDGKLYRKVDTRRKTFEDGVITTYAADGNIVSKVPVNNGK